MQRQVDAVRKTLLENEEWRNVPVTPVILFMRDDNWPLLSFRPLRFGEVYVLWGKALGKLLRANETIPKEKLSQFERLLASALPNR
jgi:hypothetical protein